MSLLIASSSKLIFALIFILIIFSVKGYNEKCNRRGTVINNTIEYRCPGELLFEDNFLYKKLNISTWTLERRFSTEPDYEFNLYIDDDNEVVKVNNGFLTIRPKPTGNHVPNIKRSMKNGKLDFGLPPLMTAQLSTKNSFTFKYGRVEIRAKLPKADWVFPQLWLQPVSNKYGFEKYQSGQMRIIFSRTNGNDMELYGGIIMNDGTNWLNEMMFRKQEMNSRTDYGNEFHVYSINWTKDEISFFVDNQEYYKILAKNLSLRDRSNHEVPNFSLLGTGSKLAPFDEEFYITIGYGIGGHTAFEDYYKWRIPKPWINSSPRASEEFWNSVKNNKKWLDSGDFIIDYVKVFNLY